MLPNGRAGRVRSSSSESSSSRERWNAEVSPASRASFQTRTSLTAPCSGAPPPASLPRSTAEAGSVPPAARLPPASACTGPSGTGLPFTRSEAAPPLARLPRRSRESETWYHTPRRMRTPTAVSAAIVVCCSDTRRSASSSPPAPAPALPAVPPSEMVNAPPSCASTCVGVRAAFGPCHENQSSTANSSP